MLAIFLTGRMVDSTAELVRLFRSYRPPYAVDLPIGDTAPLDQGTLRLDASFGGELMVKPTHDDVRLLTPPMPDASDHARLNEAIFEDATISDVEPDDATTPSPSLAAITQPPDASPGAFQQALPKTTAADTTSADATSPPKAAPPVRCGWRMCEEGEQCCNWNCSTCVRRGETCPLFCGYPTAPVSTPCGPNTCNVSEICCNPSCGICVPTGGTCSKEPCVGMYYPASFTCGMNTCNTGQVCCNPSCGICTNPGESCSLDPCP